MADLLIRTMEPDDLTWALDRAADEGWNPGLNDGDCFRAADPGGFLVAEIDSRAVGCISAVAYGSEHGFIGFYIVVPEFRRHGHGMSLWKRAMDRLGDRNVGLDGVVEQQPNYRRSGFRLAWKNVRFEARGIRAPLRMPELVPIDKVPMPDLLAFDRRHFPADRSPFLRCWTTMPGGRGLAHVENGELRGFGLVRPCRVGYKIGPLFADSADVAGPMVEELAGRCAPGAPVYLDVPEPNGSAMDLAARHAMRPVFETARMYTGEPPPIRLDGVYGITTFELG